MELEDYCSYSSFENNLSLMAVTMSGAIIGVLLNGKIAINFTVGFFQFFLPYTFIPISAIDFKLSDNFRICLHTQPRHEY